MQSPPPTEDELRTAYSVAYRPYRPAWKESGWPLWKILRELTTRRRMRRLRKYGSGTRMLEVGAGAGDFLYAARQAGWNVCAVEYSDSVAEALRTELALDVHTGELKAGAWESGGFDVVALWSVVEHVVNPVETLSTACSYLKSGGVALIQIPTASGVQLGKAFGEYWALLDLPRHLNFFGRKSLSEICARAGMELVLFKTPLLDSAWCYFASSLDYASCSKTVLNKLARLLLCSVVGIAALPYLAFHAWRQQGTEAFAVAIKR